MRNEKGLTQKELAEITGVADSAIARWESTDTDPKLSTLLRLSKALDCYVSELLGELPDAAD